MNREQFLQAFDIDPAAAAAVLDRTAQEHDHDHPWYVTAMLALGSWVTAIVIVALGGFFIDLALDLDGEDFGSVMAVIGAVIFTAMGGLLRRRMAATFAAHLTTALAAAGQAMLAVGAGIVGDGVWPAALVAVLCAVAVATLLENRMLQALSSAWAAILVFVALEIENFPYVFEFTALCVTAGVLLRLYPPRRNLVPTATILLVTGPVFAIAFDFRHLSDTAEVTPLSFWMAKAIFIALTLFLVRTIWRHTPHLELALFAAAAVAVSLLLPTGGAAALVIMVLAYVLGSHLLALLGVLLQGYFLWRFYYDLDITLLSKSALLAGVGVLLLGLWGLMARTGVRQEDS